MSNIRTQLELFKIVNHLLSVYTEVTDAPQEILFDEHNNKHNKLSSYLSFFWAADDVLPLVFLFAPHDEEYSHFP